MRSNIRRSADLCWYIVATACVLGIIALCIVGIIYPRQEPQVTVRSAPAEAAQTEPEQPRPVSMSYIEPVETKEVRAIVSVLAEEPAPEPEPTYTADDLDVLSRIMACEMGSEWIPDAEQRNMGSVVLNRVADGRFPGTIREVVYQPGQYSPVASGWIETVTPDERTIANARWLLEHGSTLPAEVIYQSCEPQGTGTYATYYDAALGTTTYYCY